MYINIKKWFARRMVASKLLYGYLIKFIFYIFTATSYVLTEGRCLASTSV